LPGPQSHANAAVDQEHCIKRQNPGLLVPDSWEYALNARPEWYQEWSLSEHQSDHLGL